PRTSRAPPASSSGQSLPKHDVRRVAGAEVDARQFLPAVLRVEAARLARPELRRKQRPVVRLPRQELGEQRAPDALALPGRPDVQLHDFVVREVEPLLALTGAERARDTSRPPLPVRAGVAVGEPNDLVRRTRG